MITALANTIATDLTKANRIRLATAGERCLALAALAAVTMPCFAFAQVIGGGGGGPFSGLVAYFQNNIMLDLATLAVIVAGVSMFFLRFHLITILAVCAGIFVMFNAATIVSSISSISGG